MIATYSRARFTARTASPPLRSALLLADPRLLADLLAQVVQLGAPHVADAMTSIFSILGECSGNVRSTPTPNDCLRTVKVSRTPCPDA